jgi:hypothetical protein
MELDLQEIWFVFVDCIYVTQKVTLMNRKVTKGK